MQLFDQKLVMMGVNFGCRMTVIRLQDGRLFLHSPVRLTPDVQRELDNMGRVGVVVAPNSFHHLFIKHYMAAYPQAEFLAVRELEKKRKDLGFTGFLEDLEPDVWKEDLEFTVIYGSRFYSEAVFFHKSSKSLILTDLCMNFEDEYGPGQKILLKTMGVHHRLGPTRLVRVLMRDKVAFREALSRILEWPFERLIFSHGRIVSENARERFEQAFAREMGE